MKTEAMITTLALFALTAPGVVKAKTTNYKASVEVKKEITGSKFDKRKRHRVKGFVFEDLNQDGIHQAGEPAIPGVLVSNGREVVETGDNGKYQLLAYDGMTVFITNPANYEVPVDGNNMPQFFYHHLPNG